MDGEKIAQPQELVMLSYIERFGTAAIYDRSLNFYEVFNMVKAENIQTLYEAKASSDDWVEFARKNKEYAIMLDEAMLYAHELGFIKDVG